MKLKTCMSKTTWIAVTLIGSILCYTQKADASMWQGTVTPWQCCSSNPFVIEQGDSTVYSFRLRGSFGASYDCDWIPSIKIVPNYTSEELFFSLDPIELVTEKTWPIQHLSAGETQWFDFYVYISDVQLPPTLPDEKYRLSVAWRSDPVNTGGGITITGEAHASVFLKVTPEPATFALFSLAGLLLRKRHRNYG